MTVTLSKRADINLDSVLRVAWRQESVVISEDALAEITRRNAEDSLDGLGIADAYLDVGLLAETRVGVDGRAFDEHASHRVEGGLTARFSYGMEMAEDGAI